MIADSTNEAKRNLLVSPCQTVTSASASMSRWQRTDPIGEGGTTKAQIRCSSLGGPGGRVMGCGGCGRSPRRSLPAPGARPGCRPATRAAPAEADRRRGCESTPGSAGHPPRAPNGRRRRRSAAARASARGRPGRAGPADRVKVEPPCRDQIDEGHRDVLVEQGGTFGHEGSAMFRPILVRGTDDLDRGDQPAMTLSVIDSHLVLVLLRQVDSNVKSRTRRCPDRSRTPPSRPRFAAAERSPSRPSRQSQRAAPGGRGARPRSAAGGSGSVPSR